MGLCIIGAREVESYRTYKNAILIDIREENDYVQGHIPGAINVPAHHLQSYMRQTDKNRIHIFYCQHGGLSFQAGKRYIRDGFRICSLAGGMDGYHRWEMESR